MKDFTTTIPYIARDPLYSVEKPFSCDFDHGTSVFATNHMFDPTPVTVRDVAGAKDDDADALEKFDIDTHGFRVLRGAKTAIDPEVALRNKAAMEEAYAEEVVALLRREFPEYERFEMMNVVTRKRDPRYPSPGTVEIVSHEQPAGVPHCDFSLGGLPLQIELSFPGQWEHLKGQDFDVLNLWRPLHGPNDDWPLAVCDFSSIDEKDMILNDDLHRDRAGENTLLHPNEQHRWYYIGGQTIEDVLVFRIIDSTGKRARGFHCAVNSPHAPPGQLRTSIEIRVVAVR